MACNHLTYLSKHIFQGLNNLLSLQLDRNRISSITNSSFESCSKLQILDLSNNRLNKLEIIRHILQHTPGLHELDIQNNTFMYFNSPEISNRSLALNSLDISHNPLKSFRLTSDIFPKLTTLNLYNCSQKDMIWDVQNKSFLQHVSKLYLGGGHMSLESLRAVLQTVNSSLTSLTLNDESEALSPLITVACRIPTLTSLLLTKNRITAVPGDLLKSCGQLTYLGLSNNSISNVSGSSFTALQQLASLKMSQNNLTSVPTVISNLTKLKTLDLSHNNIRRLGCSDFAHLTQLTVLTLFSNLISKLEACFFQDLNALEILRLSNNRIHSLGKAFKNSLPNLKSLYLNSNKLTNIKHRTFKSLRSLTNLTLVSNQINILESGAFEGLINLKKLTLSQNQIDCGKQGIRQEVFSRLSHLTHLNMFDNKCQYDTDDTIPDPPFANLSSLQTLIIFTQHHRLKSNLPANFLKGLTNLSELKARNIRITSLKPEMFTHTPQLKSLEINSNNLVKLDPELFLPIQKLEQLFVSTTKLQSLDFLIHANLSKQAQQNAFSIINETVLKSLPALTYLDLQRNDFTCDCTNAWLLDFIENNAQTQVLEGHSYTCIFPANLKGSQLLDLDTRSCLESISFSFYVSTTCAVLAVLAGALSRHHLRRQVVYAYYLFRAFLFDAKRKNGRGACQYDAFVSYNVHDEGPWVLRQMLPVLEGEQGWKLCLHHRDFQPGKAIIDNITDAIYSSRKTICVISRRYLESEWCSREIQVASFRLFDERKDVLILVFLEEIPAQQLSSYHEMRRLLKRQTYLSWPRAAQHSRLFWHKLRLAPETSEGSGEENSLITGLEGP
ncbi:LOW QUALITY PROTEIN: toll-like receptor 13 [Osmerus eperlanus]|uniref:LOW QUALITY PROTEIN: toll-like receptor 13 n=1 Tax=Osmerus eperlanus TaxID=29151 RepID=UPI002E1486DC